MGTHGLICLCSVYQQLVAGNTSSCRLSCLGGEAHSHCCVLHTWGSAWEWPALSQSSADEAFKLHMFGVGFFVCFFLSRNQIFAYYYFKCTVVKLGPALPQGVAKSFCRARWLRGLRPGVSFCCC